MLAWPVCKYCFVRACSRVRAYPPGRNRLSLLLLEGLPSWMDRGLLLIANRKGLSNPDRQMEQSTGDRRFNSTPYDKGKLLRHGMSGYNLSTYPGGLPPARAGFHTGKASGVLT